MVQLSAPVSGPLRAALHELPGNAGSMRRVAKCSLSDTFVGCRVGAHWAPQKDELDHGVGRASSQDLQERGSMGWAHGPHTALVSPSNAWPTVLGFRRVENWTARGGVFYGVIL